jgi:hypothetical protein
MYELENSNTRADITPQQDSKLCTCATDMCICTKQADILMYTAQRMGD